MSVKVSAYLTLVHPLLEYAAVVWDPYYQSDILYLLLEKVQCRAAWWVLCDYNQYMAYTGSSAQNF